MRYQFNYNKIKRMRKEGWTRIEIIKSIAYEIQYKLGLQKVPF